MGYEYDSEYSGGGYSYPGSYEQSGEVVNPVESTNEPDYSDCSNDANPYASEYVNSDINNSLDSSAGVDLNDN